mgnify:FL=1
MGQKYVLTRLRTIWGIDLQEINTHFSATINRHFQKEIRPYLNSSYLQQLNNKIILTDEGVFIADKITSDLFIV